MRPVQGCAAIGREVDVIGRRYGGVRATDRDVHVGGCRDVHSVAVGVGGNDGNGREQFSLRPDDRRSRRGHVQRALGVDPQRRVVTISRRERGKSVGPHSKHARPVSVAPAAASTALSRAFQPVPGRQEITLTEAMMAWL